MPFDQHREARRIDLVIPGMRCAGCMTAVEACLTSAPGVSSARANLSAHTARVEIMPGLTDAEALIEALAAEGYQARPYDPALHGGRQVDSKGRDLLIRLGVAGFAAMNVMLLSVSVWSGAEAATRDLLHWVSALIALPAVIYAGQPFFQSACGALAARRVNMDVPISLAVILAGANSVSETARGGPHAYFDAAVMLLFFLLIGRYLEHRTRVTARSAAGALMEMTGRTALQIGPDGARQTVPLAALAPGMTIEVAPGERIPADGEITVGRTDLDRSLITGESLPEAATPGTAVHAGMLNLTGLIRVEVSATGDGTLLAEIARMVDAAERGKGRLDRLADRVAKIYVPVVHILAAAAFIGWFAALGDAHAALQIAVAVLIVTCPCALALAVPTVHTVASARLFERGIFLKDGGELERLALVDTVVFDKTGTLTGSMPELVNAPPADDPAWPVALALATASRHPMSRAIAKAAADLAIDPAPVSEITEQPGFGVEGVWQGTPVRLGRPGWAGAEADDSSGVGLSIDGEITHFEMAETLRPGAVGTCRSLKSRGLDLAILSGDRAPAVKRIAAQTGITHEVSGLVPADKLAWLEACRADGRTVLMVGDGLNDSPALAAAHCSMSPANASDVAKTAAGLVFTAEGLGAVADAHQIARSARRRMLESFGIAALYNSIAIPLAMAGYVTPLIAALAMSGSSILVVLNALRLKGRP